MNNWQPIETATDEQGPIILFDGSNEDGDTWVGRRMTYPHSNRGLDGWSCQHGWCAFDAPTHWQHLPEPPKEQT